MKDVFIFQFKTVFFLFNSNSFGKGIELVTHATANGKFETFKFGWNFARNI